MNEILKEYAIKAMAWLETGAGWIVGEVPLYIEEILKWNVAQSVVYAIVLLILIVFFIISIIWGFKKLWKSFEEVTFLFLMFPTAALIGFICGFVSSILTIIQITVAPRVFLVEYLANILSN